MNKPWHEQNRMRRNATIEQRLAWHIEHQRHCQCRPIPQSLVPLLAERQPMDAPPRKRRS
jgi:hypothetical protein